MVDVRVRRALLVAALVVVVGLGTEAFLSWVPLSVWSSPRPATCLASRCFCEAIRWGEPVLQPHLAAGVVIFYALARARKDGSWARRARLAYWVYATAAIAALVLVPDLRRWLFAVLLTLGIAMEVTGPLRSRPRGDTRIFLAGNTVFAAAFLIWWLDQSLLLCSPTSPLQGHATWHLLGAVAAWLLFVYYTREWRLH